MLEMEEKCLLEVAFEVIEGHLSFQNLDDLISYLARIYFPTFVLIKGLRNHLLEITEITSKYLYSPPMLQRVLSRNQEQSTGHHALWWIPRREK